MVDNGGQNIPVFDVKKNMFDVKSQFVEEWRYFMIGRHSNTSPNLKKTRVT